MWTVSATWGASSFATELIGRQHPRIFARLEVVGPQFRACWVGSMLTQRLLAISTRQLYSQFCCFACETWVLSQSIRTAFAGFHHQVARRLTNRRIRLDPQTQQWVYPSSNQALQDAGLYRMETYMASRRDHTLAKVQGSPLFLATQDPQGGVGCTQLGNPIL
jgi:hypothetical protein